ncbi:unnamed protein product [Diamesa serratosioi]
MIIMTFSNHFRRNLIVLVCASFAIASLSSALEIPCDYGNKFIDDDLIVYSAVVTSLEQTDPFVITGITDLPSDMKRIDIQHFAITKNDTYECQTSYIPKRISVYFPSLFYMEITDVALKFIAKEDFAGMDVMKTLSLQNNLIESIPTDAFSTMQELETLNLDGNMLEIIENNLFKFNGKLEFITLNDNKIKYIGYRTFSHLNALNKVFLNNNDCINYEYETGSDFKASITQFNDKIRTECGDKSLASEIYMKEIEQLMNRVRVINMQLKDDHGMKLMRIVEKF